MGWPRRIWVLDPEGHNPLQITTDTSEEVAHVAPAWSPDGRKIVFQNLVSTVRHSRGKPRIEADELGHERLLHQPASLMVAIGPRRQNRLPGLVAGWKVGVVRPLPAAGW
jgi:WD40-like Beta Propeller Repeat